MTTEEWDRIRDLFHRALELEPAARGAFVEQHAGDPDVQREILSLLRAHPHAETAGFLETPPGISDLPDLLPRLAAGDRIGPFEIVGLVGAGGMGEVYRARDTRLDRTVAIKVLSPALAGDPVGHERFAREARAVSKLSHPHICTLLDVGSAVVGDGEVRYLVMEFVEGETLAARLTRGALPVDQAIACGVEIVEALAAAHAAGVVHRDLKPANIVLTRSGVKLLDFGLARFRPTEPVGLAAEAAQPLTGDGLVVGTIPYMAPEQLKGKDADPRSDIFAFGAVLYEMVAGSRAFEADSQAELVAAILERQPAPLAARQPLTPPTLDRLVTTCLAKDPDDRWQSAHDIALELKGLREGSSDAPAAQTLPGAARRSGTAARWRVHAAWAAIALALAAAVWALPATATAPAVPPNPVPVVVLMDSPLEGRVYDPRTLAAGGTNADDISDALRGLNIAIHKENTSPMWHREEQVRQQRPDLVVSHLSGFADLRWAPTGTELNEALFDLAQNRLTLFFAYQAATNPRVRFLVYSRGRLWPTKTAEDAWVAEVEARFPQLKGRLFTMVVPGGGKATFRDPATAKALLARVEQVLRLP